MADRAVSLPLPIQVVIDDVGWWSGTDGHERGEPYRTGIARDHQPADYRAIDLLGRRLGMRPQAAMVLCEWDRIDRLRGLPSATWQGGDWRNRWVGPWLDEAAAVVRDGCFEPVLHGVGHEWWDQAGMSRAEWFDAHGAMRPADDARAHLDAFMALWAENELGPPPTAFVPCAFLYTLGGGLAPLLREHGITSVSTPFGRLGGAPEAGWLADDDGLPVIDRGRDLLPWYAIGQVPEGEVTGPVCGLHWPGLLHPDPARNGEAVEGWVRLLAPYDDRPDRMLAPDTARWLSQLRHHLGTRVTHVAGGARLDLDPAAGSWLRVKVAGEAPVTVTGAGLTAQGVAGGWRWLDLQTCDGGPLVLHWAADTRRSR